MIFGNPSLPPVTPALYAESARNLPAKHVEVTFPLELEHLRYTYPNRLIALDGGKVLLRLRDDPLIEVDPASLECSIVGWSLKIPYDEIHDISRLLARRFLQLLRRAKSQQLTEDEEYDWISILGQVDYQIFSLEREPPRYVEGKILRKTPKLRVEWHDGQTEYISSGAGAALLVLNEGESFGAFVKWGRDGIESIERVDFLPDLPINE
jgi:hypothetical protein